MITKILIQELIGLFLCEMGFRKYDLDTKKRAEESIFFPRSQGHVLHKSQKSVLLAFSAIVNVALLEHLVTF